MDVLTWKGDTVMIYFNSDYLEGAHTHALAKLNMVRP